MAFGFGNVVGSLAGPLGAMAFLGNATRLGRVARGYLAVDTAVNVYHGAKAAYDIGSKLARGQDVEWMDALGLLGFAGAGSNLASFGRAGYAGRVGKAAAAGEKAVLGALGWGVGKAWGATGYTLGTPMRVADWAATKVFGANPFGKAAHLLDGTRLERGMKAVADWLHVKACFPGEMPMETPTGSTLAREVRVGDLLLSRDEHDPEGLVVAQLVEEVFVRQALVWALGVRGRVIRTAAEHPFWVQGRGWTAWQTFPAEWRNVLIGANG